MKHRRTKEIALGLMGVFAVSFAALGITLTISPIPQNVLSTMTLGLVGSDFSDPAGSVNLTVGGCTAGQTWKITVFKRTATTPSIFSYAKVRRTGGGSGTGPAPTGGDVGFLPLPEDGLPAADFFSGTFDRANVPVAWTIGPLSVASAPATSVYKIQFIFTVVATS